MGDVIESNVAVVGRTAEPWTSSVCPCPGCDVHGRAAGPDLSRRGSRTARENAGHVDDETRRDRGRRVCDHPQASRTASDFKAVVPCQNKIILKNFSR